MPPEHGMGNIARNRAKSRVTSRRKKTAVSLTSGRATLQSIPEAMVYQMQLTGHSFRLQITAWLIGSWRPIAVKGTSIAFSKVKILLPFNDSAVFAMPNSGSRSLRKFLTAFPGDNFRERVITVNLEPNQVTDRKYYYYHRDIIKVIKLLIGYPGFADNLHYTSVQQWNSDGDGNKVRAYNNMHTAGWWWWEI
jgi:Plavaka transposase